MTGTRMVKLPTRLVQRTGERGQTLVEYALIMLLIALASIPAILLIWPALEPGFQTVIDTLT